MLDLNNAPLQGESAAAPLWAHSRAPSAAASPGEAVAAFRAAAQARGVLLPPELITDGEIRRCDAVGRNGDGDAAYLLHLDGLPAGGFQNWQDGLGWQDWHADPGRPLTPAENDELRRKAESDRAKRTAARDKSRADTAARAAAIWEKASPEPDHPYLARKGIAAHGARREDRTDNLVVPLYDETGAIVNIERIDHAGEKLFLKGGRKQGCSFTIGAPNGGGPILIAEGYSTAASAHQATGLPVVVAFDSGNLLPVAELVRAAFPGSQILFLADDDWKNKTGNVGVDKAREAAARINGRVVVPEFGPDRPDGATDFNDVAAIAGEAEVKRQIEAALGQPEPEGKREPDKADLIVIDRGDPYTNAKGFVSRNFTAQSWYTLRHHRAAFYHWTGASYREVTDQNLRAQLWEWLSRCLWRDPEGKLQPVKPAIPMVTNHLDALRAASWLDEAVAAPAWLDAAVAAPANEIVACQNGLLHLPTAALLAHTPAFYNHNALDFAYRPDAPEPEHWLAFLDQLWPGDPVAIETLGEIFGYCLTGDTRQQKAFLIVGPKRSGKGTVARILTRLIGVDNTTAPTLAGLGTNFGIEPLIGKRVAIISDARLGGRADQQVIAERLLSISGEDSLTVDRKNRLAWTGRLQVRFLVLSNELPRLADASGALASRFIVLVLRHSFFGNEDLALTDRLLTELPGILNWSIAGWRRLAERGHFRQPESAREAVRDLEDLGSPISAFLRDRCKVGAGLTALADDVFKSWVGWCEEQGRDHAGHKGSFGRDLHAAVPGLRTMNLRDGAARHRHYEGIAIKPIVVEPPGNGLDLNDAPAQPWWSK